MSEGEPQVDRGESTEEAEAASARPGRIQLIHNSSQKVWLNGREIIASGTIHCRGETIEIVPFPRYSTGPKIIFTFFDATKPDPSAEVRLGPLRGGAAMRKKMRNFEYSHICFNWNLTSRVFFNEPYEVATYRGHKILADLSCQLLETGASPRRRFHYTMFYETPRTAVGQ